MVKAAIALCSILLWLATASYASELSERHYLSEQPIVLTASRLAQPIMDAPNSITVLDRNLIEASGYHNISDLFRLVPGMYVGQTSGWYRSVTHTMADEYARRMQILVDGISVYLPSFGGVRWDLLPIAIDDIERIEVVRGPNAATYGANAFTGVINIITRDPEDVSGRMLKHVAGDQGHSETWFRWAGVMGDSHHRITLGHREDGGFMNQLDDERSDILSYRGKLRLGPEQELGLHLDMIQGIRASGDPGDPKSLPHNQNENTYFAQVDYRLIVDEHTELLAKLSANRQSTRENKPTSLPGCAGCFYNSDLLSLRHHGEVQLNTDHGQGIRSSLGGYLRQDQVKSYLYWHTDSALTAHSVGIFSHLEWRIHPQVILNTGALLEKYELVDAKISPRLTLTWQPSNNHSVRLGASTAYRNPVLAESNADMRINLLNADGSPAIALNPIYQSWHKLKPEHIENTEIAYLGEWQNSGISLDARIYREKITDFIDSYCTGSCSGANPASPRVFYNNGSAVQSGFEMQLRLMRSARSGAIFNYSSLHVDSNFLSDTYSPPNIYGLHLLYGGHDDYQLMLSNYWVSSFTPLGHTSSSPFFRRADVHVSKNINSDGFRAQIAFGVENIGSSGYRDFVNSTKNIFDTRSYVHLKITY